MIEKGLIGKEDINFGTDTAQRRSQSGSLIAITKVNASHIPIVDASGRFTGTDIEAALGEVHIMDGDGSDLKDYTNQSGTTRAVGDVVIIDTANNNSFTTTTSAGNIKVLGVVGESIAVGAAGKVITGGFCTTLAVDAATARGNFLKTSATATKATPTAAAVGGSFAMALSSTAGAGTVSAFVFSVIGQSFLPLSGGNLTGTFGLKAGAAIPSASTLNPWSSGNVGNEFNVTGTTNITSIITSGNVGTIIILHFDDALTIVYDPLYIRLPGLINFVTGTGDELIFREYSAGQWILIGWMDASTTGSGDVVRATTPTLTTPKVNVINEATAASGVTVDGLLIKDAALGTANSVPNTTLQQYSAGNYILYASATARIETGTTYNELKTVKISRGGTYTVSFDLANVSPGTGNGKATIYKNGATYGTERTNSGTILTYSENVTVASGDTIEIWAKTTPASTGAEVSNLLVMCAEEGLLNGS